MNLSPERRRALTAKAQALTANMDEAIPYLMSRGISREVAEMFSLGYCDSGMERGRLSIPYLTPGGVVQIKYRCTDMGHGEHKETDCPKYLYESGCGVHLFNAQVLIYSGETVVVTEGELDAICVQAYCGMPAVGFPGTETWKAQKHYRLCFEGVQEVIVVADGDKPGRNAAKQVAESIGIHARVVDLGDGLDANSFIHTKGASAFAERISQ